MSDTISNFTTAIIGGGSAAEELIRQLAGSEEGIVVFEPELVGGECPFVACMPSKSMLHDRSIGRSWDEAVERRDEITAHLDDGEHAEEARSLGATIVRARARVTAEHTVEADGKIYDVDRIVVASGATPRFPPIDGLDPDHPLVWTSRDALTSTDRPERIVIVGGGVIGSELAFVYSGFGSSVTTVDTVDRPASDLHPRVGEIIVEVLEGAGVTVINSARPERVESGDNEVTVHLADGSSHTGDVLIVATGRAPDLSDVLLDGLELDEARLDGSGRLVGSDSVWVAGDAAGLGQYTHIANHHARVIANHVIGDGSRRYDDVTTPACIFIDPPVMVVGATWAELEDDDDIVWATLDVDTARGITDEHRTGFLAVAARRSTGRVVAAHGIGPRFDEIVHALVVAIDGDVPVRRLAQMIQPFPTVGEVLHQAFTQLDEQLT